MTSAAPNAPKVPTNYQGNSKLEKEIKTEKVETKSEPRIKKVEGVTIVKTKKSIGRRIKDSFGGQDARSVGMFLLMDVVLPNTRDLLFDLIHEGARRSIYGDQARRSTGPTTLIGSVGNKARTTNYSSVTASSFLTGNRTQGDTSVTRNAGPGFDFSVFVIAEADKAVQIIEEMAAAINQFGYVTVADLYDNLEVTGNGFTDAKFGWDAKAFQSAKAARTREGWILDLPEPIAIVN